MKSGRSSICVPKIKGTPGYIIEVFTSLGGKKMCTPKIKQLNHTLYNYSERHVLKFQDNPCSSELVVRSTTHGDILMT